MAPRGDRAGSIKASWSGPLFEGMRCWNTDLGGGLTVIYFYPEVQDLKDRLAALEADPSPIIDGLEERWQFGEQLRREMHAEWAPDPHPDFRSSQLPEMLRQLRSFVNCYERAFAQKTEWELVPPQGADRRASVR
jgi:hypothetical protein